VKGIPRRRASPPVRAPLHPIAGPRSRPVRFFRRNAARWQGAVHEVLDVKGRVSEMTGWLEHRTLPTYSAFLEKIDRHVDTDHHDRNNYKIFENFPRKIFVKDRHHFWNERMIRLNRK